MLFVVCSVTVCFVAHVLRSPIVCYLQTGEGGLCKASVKILCKEPKYSYKRVEKMAGNTS
jgi:hypothetical protein